MHNNPTTEKCKFDLILVFTRSISARQRQISIIVNVIKSKHAIITEPSLETRIHPGEVSFCRQEHSVSSIQLLKCSSENTVRHRTSHANTSPVVQNCITIVHAEIKLANNTNNFILGEAKNEEISEKTVR